MSFIKVNAAGRHISANLFARRALHQSSYSYNSTPEWEQLVGGRAGVERQRQRYESKYSNLIEQKAQEKGLTTEQYKQLKIEQQARVDKAAQLKLRPNAHAQGSPSPVEAGSEMQRSTGEQSTSQPKVVRPPPSAAQTASKPKPPPPSTRDNPVKPLHEIMDLTKASTLSRDQLAQLWTTYHQTKGFLSAAIPTETYKLMIDNGKRYPMFVLPLAREVPGALPDGQETEAAVEMHLLEWAILPRPSTVTEPVPSPSSVLFTPLAEYKARQNFSQPYLILTHYTDLALSHGTVLMRGELTDNVALDQLHAQVLAVRMQLFYNNSVVQDKLASGTVKEPTAMEKARAELLKDFHERPEQFNVEQLIKSGEISEV